MKIIAKNRKASYDYFLEEKFEAGMVLVGSEVKSIRNNQISLAESYVDIINDEVFLRGAHIAEFKQANNFNHEEVRDRKLLLNKREINKLRTAQTQAGYTIVPTMIYLSKGFIKLEIAIARGKANYDKRETIKKRDAEREIARSLKDY